MMITAFINRLTGFLRRGNRQEAIDSSTRPASERDRAPLISPITIGLLEAVTIRHALAVQWDPHIGMAAHRYQIDASPRRLAAWLATIAHESARFTRLVENLNYSAEGLAATWPARYATWEYQHDRKRPPLRTSPTGWYLVLPARARANGSYERRLRQGRLARRLG